MKEHAFVRQQRGVYTTKDHRFYLEFCSSLDTWKLRERGELVGYKPSVSRTARAESPIWYRSNSARAAVAWAKRRLVDFTLNERATERNRRATRLLHDPAAPSTTTGSGGGVRTPIHERREDTESEVPDGESAGDERGGNRW
jgi:hypothetical protein